MAFCEKCGGQIKDEMKFCDKCGVPVTQSDVLKQEVISEEVLVDNVANSDAIAKQYSDAKTDITVVSADIKASAESIVDSIKTRLPEKLVTPGDKTLHWIGFGSLVILAFTYVTCFFVFMADICTPIALGVVGDKGGTEGACALWMIAYFVFNLFPIYFAITALKYESSKKPAMLCAVVSTILTLFSFIAWGCCDAGSFPEALELYTGGRADVFAWYVLNDCLSEVWYVKLILASMTVFGFGMNYFVNKEN